MVDNRQSDVPRSYETVVLTMPDADLKGSIDLFEFAAFMRARLFKSCVVMLVVTGIVVVASFLVTPTYRSEAALVAVNYQESNTSLSALNGSIGGLAALAGVNLGGASGGREGIAILRSRKFLTEFIEDSDIAPLLFAERWDSVNSDWLTKEEAPTENEVVRYFQEEILQISESSDDGLIFLRIDWRDRLQAAEWANALVAAVNRHIRKEKIAEATKSLEFLEREQISSSVVEVKQGIFALIQQQIETIMLANVQQEYAFKVIDPAVPSDKDDLQSPNRPMWIAWAVILSSFFLLLFWVARFSVFKSTENDPAASA